MARIGDLSEIPGEVIFKWKIKDFFSLPKEINTTYDSPRFYFSGASWELRIYPNGRNKHGTVGWIGLFLKKRSSGSIKVNCSFFLKSNNGNVSFEKRLKCHILKKNAGKGIWFMKTEMLLEGKSNFTSTNDLTIFCKMENNKPNAVARSLFRRYQDISDNLRKIYEEGRRPDFALKCKKKKIKAHRLILETRSPVFKAMFSHDTKENQAGEVVIDDVDKSTMDSLLMHMYSGDIHNPTKENVLFLYAAAEKYDIKDVREICLEFINQNLSIEWVCDVIKFAELYQEEEVSCRAKEYFKLNADEILESENWKTFVEENSDFAVELLGTLVKSFQKEKAQGNKVMQPNL